MCAFMHLSHDWSMRDLLESSVPVAYSEHVTTIAHLHVYCFSIEIKFTGFGHIEQKIEQFVA